MKKIRLKINPKGVHSVKLEESQNFNYKHEKPLKSTRRRRDGHAQDDIERHTCSRCSKSYMHAWHLKRHTKFECGKEPRVQCPYCFVKMKQRGHVYRHIRQCHRNKTVYVIDLNWKISSLTREKSNHGASVLNLQYLRRFADFYYTYLTSDVADVILKQLSYITDIFRSLLLRLFVSFTYF